ncbi:unnamed protein product [Angiostrongylus costaricensis]|uniref:G protein-coupled receptor n=1 Tax=Angiostrongylus costaricensis TaxID=334426 RepID=A0A0R3Q0E3_ANGCS|nr:unnamed protein product [Angiostrongylus costaricensis]
MARKLSLCKSSERTIRRKFHSSMYVLQRLQQRNLTYLMWISGCDILVSISYTAIMCVQVYTDYFDFFILFYLWHQYLRAAFTVSHITLSSSSFLLMAATIERYFQSTADYRHEKLFRILSRYRAMVVVLCFAASCLFRGTVFFEVVVVYNPRCQGFSSMGLAASRLFTNPVYDAVWKFWIRKIVTVFLPFTGGKELHTVIHRTEYNTSKTEALFDETFVFEDHMLASFNTAIVLNVRRSHRNRTVRALLLFTTIGNSVEVTRLKARLRAVTRMLVMVICTYLAANIIDVIIAFWETIDIDSLYAYERFYTVTTDISSFLPILACALRLPIYAVNDEQIRTEVGKLFLRDSTVFHVVAIWYKDGQKFNEK